MKSASKHNNPKVSVILPTFNRAHLIEKSIKSVLNQTYKKFELIIVDDLSTDNTKEVISKIADERICYLRNEKNLGPSGSRNIGIAHSQSEFIAFQDSDDQWYETKLEKQIELLSNSSDDVAAVYSGVDFFDSNSGEKIGEELNESNFGLCYKEYGTLPTPLTPTVLIRKSVIDKVGVFDNNLKVAEDTDLVIRVSKNDYKYKFINETLVKVFKNHESLMGDAESYFYAYNYLYEKHFDYLHKDILYGFSKTLSNYWLLKNNKTKARLNFRRSLNHHKNFKTVFQLICVLLFPSLLRYFYLRKYDFKIPHPTLVGKYIQNENETI